MSPIRICMLLPLVWLVACDGNSRPFEEAAEVSQLDLVGLTVSPPADSLDTIYLNHGQTLQLGVQGTTSTGGAVSLSGSDRRWRSTNPAVFGVDDNGLLTAYSDGSAEAFLIIGGIASTGFPVNVFQSPLAAIQSINGADSVDRCVPANYRALGTFGDGTTRTLDAVSWSVDNTEAARVTANADASGEFIGENVASIQLTAAVGDINGSRGVSVDDTLTDLSVGTDVSSVNVGSSRNLSATGTYTTGSTNDTGTAITRQTVITDSVQWTISDGASSLIIGNTGSIKGQITGVAVGTAVARASCGMEFSERSITVNASTPPPSNSDQLSFNVTGTTLTLSRSTDSEFRLRVSTGPDFDANQEVSEEVTWTKEDNSSSNTTSPFQLVTSGVNAGLITTTAVGSADVTASRNGVTIRITVNVVTP